ncbi:MAG: hypothetical protein V4687_01260 [Bacteroidota bacterium]
MSSLEYEELSQRDIEFIESTLYPKAKRSFVVASILILIFSLVLPYIPGKRSNKALIDQMSYPPAFFTCFLIFACFGLYMYRKSILGLKRDLNSGYKCVFKTKVTRKVWKGDQQFELVLEERPKVFSRTKYVYPVVESHCFHEGDLVVIEYLEKSEVQLRMFAQV